MPEMTQIEMIPIDRIAVVNPRVRTAKVHQEITENIGLIGLKRPITVRRLPDAEDGPQYALICGQGRLESFKALGQESIAALIVDANEEAGHIMSLVENIARRLPQPGELLEQVGVLRGKGYSDAEIGRKLGYAASWVNGVANLLERGERRLLAAVEVGNVPLTVAVQISKATEVEAQELLLEAYNRGDLKGNKVAIMRKILEGRARGRKRASVTSFGQPSSTRRMSPADLAELYQRNAEEHRRIQRRAENTQSTLLVVQQIFKELFSEAEFRALLKAEELASVPKPLMDLAKQAGLA